LLGHGSRTFPAFVPKLRAGARRPLSCFHVTQRDLLDASCRRRSDELGMARPSDRWRVETRRNVRGAPSYPPGRSMCARDGSRGVELALGIPGAAALAWGIGGAAWSARSVSLRRRRSRGDRWRGVERAVGIPGAAAVAWGIGGAAFERARSEERTSELQS